MKRILCILSSLDAGGAETFLMKNYRALSPDEVQFDFIVSKSGGCYTDEVLARGGKIYQIPMRTKNVFGALRGIYSVVKGNHYDSVLKLGENSLAVMDLIAAKLGGARHLALRSCNAPTNLSLKARCIHRFFRPLLNHTATVKLAPSKLAADFMFGKGADVTLLNNGVDLNVFRFDVEKRQAVREEFGLDGRLVIGHIGRFHSQKNHLYLLEIFKKIHEKRNDAVLLLIGVGALENQIRDRVCELELEDHVIFAGQRFDIPQVLSAMDVFVFPSLFEGMPNTVIEAQATGLSCVIADTITREADLTGLVHYLSLSNEPIVWAEKALSLTLEERKDTYSDFTRCGYNINEVAQKLIALLSD